MDKTERSRWIRAAELLDRVIDLPTAEQQAAVDRLGAAHGVRRELEFLLAGARRNSLLDGSLGAALQHVPPPMPERDALRGQVLGRWKLGDEIGSGGMSVVYHASRTGRDFQQHAALKILSVAHLGDDFVAGFVRERQILSDLRHPGIARLIDGGITPDGAPFLVMEYVRGERIDQWCRQHGASLETIARQMLKLCHAVGYAHRHLVVHQDIKPANVLVDEHDQPVLIDFGIARLLRQPSRFKPLQAFTPEYAAPEQTAGGTVTTATDVFALGTLFRNLVNDGRIDRDLTAILDAATQVDPERRYAHARGLADDLEAWLEQRPVRARPPTLRYRTERFVTRNRWAVAAATVIMLSVLGGLGAALWQARIAATERDLAQAQSARALQVTAFLKDLFRASDPDRAQGEPVSARELLDIGAQQARNSMETDPELQAEMLVLLGDLYRELGEADAAEALLAEGLPLADRVGEVSLRVDARRAMAQLRMETGAHEQALALAEEGERILRQAGAVPGDQHAALMQPMLFSLLELGRVPEAVERGRAALALARKDPGLSPTARYGYLYNTANALLIAEQPREAETLLREAAAIPSGTALNPSVQMSLQSDLSAVLGRKGDLEGALEHRRQALAIAERIYPPDHPEHARKLNNLGATLSSLGRHREAEAALRKALAIYERLYSDGMHPRVAAAHNNLGRALEQAGALRAAEPHLVRARQLAGRLFGINDPRYAVATANLGNLYRQLGDLDRADDLLQQNLALRRSLYGAEHRLVGYALSLLAALRLEQGRPAESMRLSDEALELFVRVNHDSPRAVVPAMTRRARALAALGRDREAESQFSKALRLGETEAANAGSSWPELLAAYAEFLVERADPDARSALERALEVHRDVLGPSHPETVRIEARLADFEPGAKRASP